MTPRWHIITPEYPPQIGGVSHYTYDVAAMLAVQSDEVHIWCPKSGADNRPMNGVTVHQTLGRIAVADLLKTGQLLDQFPEPRRLLVQWVPHGYGYRSINLPFCLWLRNRSKNKGDDVEIMFHEAYLPFGEGSWKQDLAASVHRLMTIVLLSAARRVWLSIPGWEPRLRPYAMGRQLEFRWLPVPSSLPVTHDAGVVERIRGQIAKDGTLLVGHFGTYGLSTTALLEPILKRLFKNQHRFTLILMGAGSQEFRRRLIQREPRVSGLVLATGVLTAGELSGYLAACDILIQPYRDGASSRRTSLMAGLSHGKPVITTCGHLTEPCWEESAAVAMVPAGDADAFVNLLEQLRSDPDERLRLGQAAYNLYCERFHIRHTISALREAWA